MAFPPPGKRGNRCAFEEPGHPTDGAVVFPKGEKPDNPAREAGFSAYPPRENRMVPRKTVPHPQGKRRQIAPHNQPEDHLVGNFPVFVP